MDERLKKVYSKVINKHYSAVQTDTALGYSDDDKSWKLEKKSKMYWAEFNDADAEFKALLDKCILPGELPW